MFALSGFHAEGVGGASGSQAWWLRGVPRRELHGKQFDPPPGSLEPNDPPALSPSGSIEPFGDMLKTVLGLEVVRP